MPVISLPEDKPRIVFYGAMMAIQNYGFFQMYYQIWPSIPVSGSATGLECDSLRFWVGFFALDCFIESFCCLWMAMGGYTDDKCMFTFGENWRISKASALLLFSNACSILPTWQAGSST